jgi:uncharacterized protein DUF6093
MGRPGTAVVPVAWSSDHAAVVARTLPSTVRIGLLGPSEWNPDTKQDERQLTVPVYVDAAEIMVVTDTAHLAVAAEEQVEVRRYEVKLLAAASSSITTDMVIVVQDDPDPQLVGRTLTIDAIERGTRRFSRVLQATLPR